jgi:hypothetical protein
MVADKDVVITLLGVSAGLAGLALVFLGLVVTTYQGFPGDTPAKVRDRYRNVAMGVLIAFVVGLGCVVVGTSWLVIRPREHGLYAAVLWLFGAQLVTPLAATGWSLNRILWGG